jgi:hypothetical protein
MFSVVRTTTGIAISASANDPPSREVADLHHVDV